MEISVRPERATYKLKEKLGEGMSSRVFAAIREDSRGFSRQEVVLKILKAETDIPSLRREFGILSRIRSPHNVNILGWENLPEGPALVLERIDGVTLADLRRHRRISRAETEEIVRQVQEGLKSVHAVGMHHGDLSPANIMIDRCGMVRLIDFARAPTHESSINTVTGTPPYMSPEVWQGLAPTMADDLFSLGLIRWELQCDQFSLALDPVSCRHRAEQLTESGCLLLCRDPQSRRFLDLPIDVNARDSIANSVREILLKRSHPQAQTEQLPPATQDERVRYRGSSYVRAVFTCLMILMIPFPPGKSNVAPSLLARSAPLRSAKLEIRSHQWLQVEIDHQPMGYAPVVADGLLPGEHTIRWRRHGAAGEVRLKLVPGEHRILHKLD